MSTPTQERPTPLTDKLQANLPVGTPWLRHCQDLERQLAEAREHRDRLAEALENIVKHQDAIAGEGMSARSTVTCIARAALAAVKGGKP